MSGMGHNVAVAYKLYNDRVTRWHNENDIDDGLRDYPKDLIWDISIKETARKFD